MNPIVNATAHRVASAWQALGLAVNVVELTASDFVNRLQGGTFTAAVVDLNIGLDPDLTPLLESTQVINGGSNVSGYQDATLDKALAAARAYANISTRKKAFSTLEGQLATAQPILPLFFRDVTMVADGTVTGPAPRDVSDPSQRFSDVVTWRVVGR